MSGDVQPRKRKDKRKKKDEEELVHHHHASSSGPDEIIHIHKESKFGGNICSKIIFFSLLGALGIMVGLIILEYHGTTNKNSEFAADSPWAVMFEGWVDDTAVHDDTEHMSHGDTHEHAPEELGETNHNDDEEEEASVEEDIEDLSFAQRTYDDLKAAYSQITPDESDAEQTDDDNLKLTDYEATESEPDLSESELHTEDEDDPGAQWNSSITPQLLAQEVEEVQTESEAEEDSEPEEPTPAPQVGGPQSINIEVIEEEHYVNADITTDADWGVRELLDDAERELDEGEHLA